MLRPMALVDQWRAIERDLPPDWPDARLLLTVSDESTAARAAALLSPAASGRSGRQIRCACTRRGGGAGPDSVQRLLARLDRERIRGALELVSTGEPAVVAETRRPTLKASWDAELATLPSDWSDLYAELELYSSDYLDRAALLMAPANPVRFGDRPGFRFRCSRSFGYGVSAEMAGRCFERLDHDGIRGEIRVLYALSDTHPVATQGPVWRIAGKAV